MSDPPRRPAEPEATEARTLARIQSEFAAFAMANGAMSAEQAMERIGRVLARAGYAVSGAQGSSFERELRSWASEDESSG